MLPLMRDMFTVGRFATSNPVRRRSTFLSFTSFIFLLFLVLNKFL